MKNLFLLLTLILIPVACPANQCDTVWVSEFDRLENGDATGAVRQAIEAARTRQAKVLAFDSKRYDLWPENATQREWFISNTSSEEECPSKVKTIGILIEEFNNLTIDGNDASLVFHGKMITLAISNSKDITVKNLSIDFERPTMSEMTIVESTPDYTDVIFHPDSRFEIDSVGHISLVGEGWRSNIFHCIEYDPTTERRDYSDVWNRLEASKARQISPNKVRFETSGLEEKTGYILTVRDIIRDQVGVFINESENIEMSDVKTHYMHGLGIVSQNSRNLSMLRVTCAPRKDSGRLIASSADFMHFSGCAGIISVADCYFSGAHDDCINVHGTNLRIVEKTDSTCAVVRFMHPQSYGFRVFEAGDTVSLVRASTMNRFATRVIKSVTRLSDREIKLEFSTPLPDGILLNSDCVENLSQTPQVEIRRCFFSNTNTRGTLVTTPRKVVIADNTYYKTGMSAILIEADASSWFESGPVCDVTIENNRFVDCGYLGGPHKAVIALNPSVQTESDTVSTGSEPKTYQPAHENVVIRNNTFETTGNPAVFALSTSPITIENNIIRPYRSSTIASNRNNSDQFSTNSPFILEN